jgi:hypothetical protein
MGYSNRLSKNWIGPTGQNRIVHPPDARHTAHRLSRNVAEQEEATTTSLRSRTKKRPWTPGDIHVHPQLLFRSIDSRRRCDPSKFLSVSSLPAANWEKCLLASCRELRKGTSLHGFIPQPKYSGRGWTTSRRPVHGVGEGNARRGGGDGSMWCGGGTDDSAWRAAAEARSSGPQQRRRQTWSCVGVRKGGDGFYLSGTWTWREKECDSARERTMPRISPI